MTNNTIPSVSRELTIERDVFGAMHIKLGDFDFIQIQYQYPYTDNASTKALAERIAALLSAPSPAGLDGLDTDRNAAFKACPESGCDWGSFYLGWKSRGEVEQAIIDGLRAKVGAQQVKTCIALKERNDAREERDSFQRVGIRAMEERDQQAQRIGELEGLLRATGEAGRQLSNAAYNLAQREGHELTKCECALLSSLRKQWDAALSAGKEGE